MEDKEKTDIAKKNLAGFLQRLSQIPDEEGKKEIVACYVSLRDGSVMEDFYWSDHEISPTAVRLWLSKNYNSYSFNDSRWATRVVLKSPEYETLKGMVFGAEPIIIEDVEIVTSE